MRSFVNGCRALGCIAGVAAILAVAGLATLAAGQGLPALPAHLIAAATPASLLAQSIPDSTPNAMQLQRGQYLIKAGDCMSCHLREGGEPLAGGLGLKTPFGVIYTPNITSHTATGIGGWTNDQFYRAMHDGIDDHGRNLYPAFPYPWFRLASREDNDAMLAYLKSTPAVDYKPPPNDLPFPFNIRFIVKGWNFFFLKNDEWQSDARQSAQWNRGAYLVNGVGHCSGCHSPKNVFGADKSGQAFQGGELDNWVAPDLTSNERTGLGRWSVEEIAEYLRTGRNVYAGAGAAMAEVVAYSTALLDEEDRQAMAVYLKSMSAGPTAPVGVPTGAAMRRGAAIYSDACTACHLENGVGQARVFPALGLNAMLQQADASGLVHLILAGSRIGTSASRPSPLAMPAFAWKLTDSEVADVSTYLRNSWGNQASAISAKEVAEARKRLKSSTVAHPALPSAPPV